MRCSERAGIGSQLDQPRNRHARRRPAPPRLRAHGLQRGDRVFILYGNNLEFFVDLLARGMSARALCRWMTD